MMKNVTQILHFNKKDTHMNTAVLFYNYKATTQDDQLHDKQTVKPNDIFEAIMEDEGHMTYAPPPLLPRLDRVQFKCDGTRAETRFLLSAKWASRFKSAWVSVQSTIGSRGVRISSSNAG